LALPFVQFKPNRILPGDGFGLATVQPGGWGLVLILTLFVLAAGFKGWPPLFGLISASAGILGVVLALGYAAQGLIPAGNSLARVAPGAGFWLMLLCFSLTAADAVTRLQPALWQRTLLLIAAILLVAALLASGLLDQISVMREYAARADLFQREALAHLWLAFGSLALALLVGLPLGIALYFNAAPAPAVLSGLNILQTIPSLALFGIMIPIFGWIAAHVPGAAQAGVAGIGVFPALTALFLYSLLPVVSNTLTGLRAVSPITREAATGLGMSQRQILFQVLIPLALPVLLAAVRIVLVQNIGLAVIAGLIGGGGFGTFVFQGLNQTAMDLVLLGALPTIALAIVAGIGMDLLVKAAASPAGTAETQ
jgi:osmoprotectant transport system permease protein